MSDINLVAYNRFRRDLAKIFNTFNSSTQTDFTEDIGIDSNLDRKDSELTLSNFYDLELD
ncbi:uncharacterized protein LOC108101238 [Drosophila ficusphila]|uniref:uncharacterized protein LOC108101238 n=1 Tax=Drosophila ficusphila TaxID=30025 RepID=UPI0007E6F53A|nr:uncharacterized protein LOC108101238 [Drosophila ficusphila]